MERKKYLECCQLYAFGKNNRVEYNGSEYFPIAYELKFNTAGVPVHTAILRDCKARSLVYCRLENVKEV